MTDFEPFSFVAGFCLGIVIVIIIFLEDIF